MEFVVYRGFERRNLEGFENKVKDKSFSFELQYWKKGCDVEKLQGN